MKVRDVLYHVGFASQVALFDKRCEPICSRFAMPANVSDLDGYKFLDYDIYLIESLCTPKGIPVLSLIVDNSVSD